MALPTGLILSINLSVSKIAEVIHYLSQVLADVGEIQPQSWSIPSESTPQPGGVAASLAAAEGRQVKTAFYIISDRSTIGIVRLPDASAWTIKFSLSQEDSAFADIPHTLVLLERVLRLFVKVGVVDSAYVIRTGSSGKCLPNVPLAALAHLIFFKTSRVEEEYDNPDVFWERGWNTIEKFGPRCLLTRAMQAADSTDFLQALLAPQWAMARAARAGRTKYFDPNPLPEEMPIFLSGQPTLNAAGYVDDEKLAEYTAVLAPGQHIHGWEVFSLHKIIQSKKLSDGRPVEQVRVVFYDEASARREKRPLLDIKARVYFENSQGQLIELTN